MCTGIKIDYRDGCVMGRTMDYEVPLKYNVIYLPRGYNYCKDLMGNPLHSKYKMMGLSFYNRDPLKDGVNEHGLIGITNEFTGFNLYSNRTEPEKLNLSSLDYFNHALGNYRDLDELLADLPNIHISTKDHQGEKVISPDFHYMFADSTKRCIVIQPKGGKLVSFDNPYGVITNSPGFESHIRRLNKLMDPDDLEGFNSSKDLPGGYDPVSRFIKAFFMTRTNVESESYSDALSGFYSIMASMTMPNGFVRNKKYNHTTYTRYICSYDTNKKLMTVKSDTNPTVYQLGFEDIEDDQNRQEFYVKQEFTAEKLV